MWAVPQPPLFRTATKSSLLSLFPLPQLADQEVLQDGHGLGACFDHPAPLQYSQLLNLIEQHA
jgi:hypothetical protein